MRFRRSAGLGSIRRAGLGLSSALALFAGAGPSRAAEVTITQKNMQFSQTELTVHRGDIVVFANDDSARHNISVRNDKTGDTTDLGIQRPQASVSYKFTDDGAYSVVCNIHPKMHLKVYVK